MMEKDMFTYGTVDENQPLNVENKREVNKVRAYAMGGAAVFFLVVLLSSTGGHSTASLAVQQQVAAQVALARQPVAAASAVDTSAVETETAVVEPPAEPDKVEPNLLPVNEGAMNSDQYNLIYNMLSLAIASMGSATVFFFFQFSMVEKQFRTALVLTGLVTLIAFYHYIRIFNSFTEAYILVSGEVSATGIPFNDAYRYVDWLLTVPLLLMELILVMHLSPDETRSYCTSLGLSAAVMIIFGYPGEISDSMGTRWMFWVLAMLPFLYIVYTLFFGLSDSINSQPYQAQGLVRTACWVTVLSWCTYPVVYIFPMLGFTGASATTAIQVGYSVADIVAKPITGILVWMIAVKKNEASK